MPLAGCSHQLKLYSESNHVVTICMQRVSQVRCSLAVCGVLIMFTVDSAPKGLYEGLETL